MQIVAGVAGEYRAVKSSERNVVRGIHLVQVVDFHEPSHSSEESLVFVAKEPAASTNAQPSEILIVDLSRQLRRLLQVPVGATDRISLDREIELGKCLHKPIVIGSPQCREKWRHLNTFILDQERSAADTRHVVSGWQLHTDS